MKQRSFALRGDLCWSRDPQHLNTLRDGWLICVDGQSAGVFRSLPEKYANLPVEDWSGHLVIPGLVDLHVHAPQYTFRGLGMDLELLDWLDRHAFPEETRYADLEYARKAYIRFVDDMKRGPNTRACVFATIHAPATLLLMDLLEKSGLVAMVGKVNMDRNSPDTLREASPEAAEETTRRWLEDAAGRYERVAPIITPRFTPSCTDDLMARLGRLRREFGVPVQSHLSENRGEVALVQELCPWSKFYGDAYDRFGLFGGDHSCIMAHCVLSGSEEIALMKKRGVYVAHCPQSNTNLASGIAPVRRYLDEGLNVGLGSDVAGGSTLSIFRAMADAIQVSKLRWRLQEQSLAPLTAPEAFWLGTAGGGAFFGRVGSFDPGYELDAVVLDDSRTAPVLPLAVEDRLERAIYLSEDRDVVKKFVRGTALW
ncbi:amidohydrolase family protein [uncultured Pseudoflavonifractor sp.]|uniref:amidohydrolase family protein n=1 Tax=uncultured Pseudoflavonifractor sp. TaxID=1221379 RepID=UPI0025D0AED3|nr:amidohydrolase family protein [uncultured Pseudoflavonifractor sp.]